MDKKIPNDTEAIRASGSVSSSKIEAYNSMPSHGKNGNQNPTAQNNYFMN